MKIVHQDTQRVLWEHVTRHYIFAEYRENDTLRVRERYQIQGIEADDKTHLYIEIEAKLGYVLYWGVCWTLLKLFTEGYGGDLPEGRRKLRFFHQSKLNPFQILEGFSFSPIDDLFANVRVCKPTRDLDRLRRPAEFATKLYPLTDIIAGIDDEE
jgi:hypothetical protein